MNFQQVTFLSSYGLSQQLPASTLGELAFCGRSNVGKSSLINRLCNRKSLARVSATPGKTTTVNFFSLGERYLLVDLPGYGYAKRSIDEKKRWADLLDRYFTSGRDIRLVVQLLDIRHDPSADDLQMIEFLEYYKQPYLVVLTKSDKLNKTEYKKQTMYFEQLFQDRQAIRVVPFCIKDDSVSVLKSEIESFIENS